MNEMTVTSRPARRERSRRHRVSLSLLIVLILALSVVGCRSREGVQAAADPISPEQFEEQVGLRIRLLAVTAGGGIIDFRLKIMDTETAREFLEDPDNLPRLIVAESGEALPDGQPMDDEIHWEEGGILFTFFPNSGGVVEPGTPMIVEFGSVRVGPIAAQ